MKAFYAAALAAAVQATHPFFAESHYICEMCQSVTRSAAAGNLDEVASLYKLHPALEAKFASFEGVPEEVDLSDSFKAC